MKIPQQPPVLHLLAEELDPERILELLFSRVEPAPGGKYRHWDTLRRMAPPEGMTLQEWWFGIKMARNQMRRTVPLQDKRHVEFYYTLPDPLLEMLHRIDSEARGQIQLPEPVTNAQTRDRYVQNSLMEEAFTSSVLEGAVSTREAARDMIRTGREPLNKSERMILNNYKAMQRISELKAEPLTPELVIQLHRIITDGTMTERASYFRTPGDGIAVYDNTTNVLLHEPPHPSELKERMEAMCRFANQEGATGFLPPVLRAIILHFWLAYDHPFIDGNGRTARALFYWSMLSQGFWLFEYVSISTILRKASAKYGRSFLYTETDDGDLTYFLLSQLRVLSRAIDELRAYLQRKVQEIRETATLLKRSDSLSHRQLALLSHALRHPDTQYTIQSHRTSHRITYETARTDLLGLAEAGLLIKQTRGKTFVFLPPQDLSDQIRRLS